MTSASRFNLWMFFAGSTATLLLHFKFMTMPITYSFTEFVFPVVDWHYHIMQAFAIATMCFLASQTFLKNSAIFKLIFSMCGIHCYIACSEATMNYADSMKSLDMNLYMVYTYICFAMKITTAVAVYTPLAEIYDSISRS